MRRQLQESIASDCLLDHSEVAGIAARQNRAGSEIARIRAETGIQSEVAVRRIEARMFASAQQTLGSINGTVTDATGAVVPAAQVKARAVATNLEVTAQSKNDGSFVISDLPIGTYAVTFTKDGFQTAAYPQILVQGSRTASRAKMRAAMNTALRDFDGEMKTPMLGILTLGPPVNGQPL